MLNSNIQSNHLPALIAGLPIVEEMINKYKSGVDQIQTHHLNMCKSKVHDQHITSKIIILASTEQ